MKFAFTSDLHGYLPDIEPCEVLCICGDVSPLDIQYDYYRMENWTRSTFAQWINNLPCKQVIMTPGNHDPFFEQIMGIDPKIYENITRPTKGKLEVLYNNECNVVGSTGENIKIWGSPYCKTFGRWAFMPGDKELLNFYSSMPKGCDIVITHDAPKVGNYGKIQQGRQKGVDAGNKDLAKVIKEKCPRYVISGHIHSAEHKLGTYKGYGITQFANVSYVDEYYQPTNDILYIDVNDI